VKIRIDTLEPRLHPEGRTEVWGAPDMLGVYHWVASFATEAHAWLFINALADTASTHLEIEPARECPRPTRANPVKLTYDEVVSLYHPHEFVGIAEFYRADDYQAILSQLAQANTEIARLRACAHVEPRQSHCGACA
jgi:hypothetical protein